MNRISACPDVQRWQQLASGRISEVEAAPLEEHLLACPACLEVVQKAAAADPVAQALATSVQLDVPTPTPATERLLDRLKELVPATGPASAETGAEAPATDSEVAPASLSEDIRSLLAPPRQPDEMGRLGGYRVLQVLGRGGMGLVFLAEDEALGPPRPAAPSNWLLINSWFCSRPATQPAPARSPTGGPWGRPPDPFPKLYLPKRSENPRQGSLPGASPRPERAQRASSWHSCHGPGRLKS
jgi:hypothetical protein